MVFFVYIKKSYSTLCVLTKKVRAFFFLKGVWGRKNSKDIFCDVVPKGPVVILCQNRNLLTDKNFRLHTLGFSVFGLST